MSISVRERFIQCISFFASTVWLQHYKCHLGLDMVFLIKKCLTTSKTGFGNLSGFLLQLLWYSSECELVWSDDHRATVYIVQHPCHVNV